MSCVCRSILVLSVLCCWHQRRIFGEWYVDGRSHQQILWSVRNVVGHWHGTRQMSVVKPLPQSLDTDWLTHWLTDRQTTDCLIFYHSLILWCQSENSMQIQYQSSVDHQSNCLKSRESLVYNNDINQACSGFKFGSSSSSLSFIRWIELHRLHNYTISHVVSDNDIWMPRRWSRCKGSPSTTMPFLQLVLMEGCWITSVFQHPQCGKWLVIHSVNLVWQHLSHFLWPIWSTNVSLGSMWFQLLWLLATTPAGVILCIWMTKMALT